MTTLRPEIAGVPYVPAVPTENVNPVAAVPSLAAVVDPTWMSVRMIAFVDPEIEKYEAAAEFAAMAVLVAEASVFADAFVAPVT